MHLESRAEVPPQVLFSRVGDDSVLLNLATETYFGLDEVGTDMWHAIADGGSLRQALHRLLERYDADPQQLGADLMALAEELAEHGLLRVGDS